jgi:hypothetical protein
LEWSNDLLDNSLIGLLAKDQVSTNNTECSTLISNEWNKFKYRQKNLSFSGTADLNKQIPEISTPFDIFSLFVNGEHQLIGALKKICPVQI